MSRKSSYAFTKQTLGIFWAHAWKYKLQVWVLVVSVLLQNALFVYKPTLYRDLIDILTLRGPDEGFRLGVYIVLLIFIVAIVSIVVRRLTNFVVNYFEPRVMGDLTNTCYEYLQQHSLGFFNSNFVGSLVTKVKRYERSFEQIADQIIYDLGSGLLSVGAVMVVLLAQYTLLGFIVLGWCLLFLVFSYFYTIFKLPYDIKRAAADTNTTAQLADSITNNVNIKLFTGYQSENKRFQNVIHEQYLLRRKSWDVAITSPISPLGSIRSCSST